MAYQIWGLLLRAGRVASIRLSDRRKEGKNIEYVVSFTLDDPKSKERKRTFYNKSIRTDNYVLAQVLKSEREEFSGYVYNFEVEEDNSYLANGYAVHNCESAACGLPCIATRYSGQTDFMDDENSYLVDIDGFQRSEEDLSWISYFYENAEFPILGPAVVEQARMMMRRAYENREEARIKAGKLREKVVREYNWKKCVSMMHDKLKLTLEGLDEWKCRRKNPS
jgi:glycosyltransferase involved in cell wall biosynthesis